MPILKLLAKQRGFTLIEVVVSLLILASTLATIMQLTSVQVDNRTVLKQRFVANSVAWNRLMVQHQILQGWRGSSFSRLERDGKSEMLGLDWYWDINTKETFGDQFYRYEVTVYDQKIPDINSSGNMVMYLVASNLR